VRDLGRDIKEASVRRDLRPRNPRSQIVRGPPNTGKKKKGRGGLKKVEGDVGVVPERKLGDHK